MAPLANGTLCLNTPKHNGKSGTAQKPCYLEVVVIYLFKYNYVIDLF
jgi:hypothetical protein